MKKSQLFPVIFTILLSTAINLSAQVSISPDNSPADNSAMLDVKSPNKGVVLPRMTFEQRNAIVNPVEGLMVYCTDCNTDATGCVSIFQGGLWKQINLNCYLPNTPTAGSHVPSVTQIIWNWNTVPIAQGYKWNTTNNYATAVDLGISTTKTETGLTCSTAFIRYVWAYNSCGSSSSLMLSQSTQQTPFSPAPLAGTNVPSSSQIVWNWNSVSGATGYKWSATNNYATATDMSTNTTKTETGLSCNTSYTRYTWAYNSCGNSTVTTLTQSTSINPSSPIASAHVPSSTQIIWNWNSVAGATGYKWSTTNNYATATDMGTSMTKTETGLTNGNTYTRYVWAYNTCGGVSISTTLNQLLVYIGISYGGGIVFYIDGTGQHGLISAINDQGTAQWGCYGTLIGCSSLAIGTGQANTTAIVNGCSTAGIAARVCDDLVLNGYSDWFLPSKDELNQMYLQKTVIVSFANCYYWCSSEDMANWAYSQYPGNGNQNATVKYVDTYYVRAIRAF